MEKSSPKQVICKDGLMTTIGEVRLPHFLETVDKDTKLIFHKHLLVNAKIKNPINTEQLGIDFLTDLVNKIDMKIIKGPFASYVDKPGNRGLTAIVMIETSHIAFHIWDEADPSLIQFDLYTCGQLDLYKVMSIFKEYFNVENMEYVLFDRENGFIAEAIGKESDGIQQNKFSNNKDYNLLTEL